jgi:hypothetical protein
MNFNNFIYDLGRKAGTISVTGASFVSANTSLDGLFIIIEFNNSVVGAFDVSEFAVTGTTGNIVNATATGSYITLELDAQILVGDTPLVSFTKTITSNVNDFTAKPVTNNSARTSPISLLIVNHGVDIVNHGNLITKG